MDSLLDVFFPLNFRRLSLLELDTYCEAGSEQCNNDEISKCWWSVLRRATGLFSSGSKSWEPTHSGSEASAGGKLIGEAAIKLLPSLPSFVTRDVRQDSLTFRSGSGTTGTGYVGERVACEKMEASVMAPSLYALAAGATEVPGSFLPLTGQIGLCSQMAGARSSVQHRYG